MSAFRSGFVAVTGRPNVGKSTLVNRLVGEKVSIVTPRPNTTRHAITGILERPGCQVILVDTPGLDMRARKLLNKAMNRTISGALGGADLGLLLVPATGWTAADDATLAQAQDSGLPLVLVVTKIDLVQPRERLLPLLRQYSTRADFAAVVPVSARREDNLEALVEVMARLLPEGPALYPSGSRTDRSPAFRVGEVIREKLMLALREELPYGVAVEIQVFEDKPGVGLVDATLWVERDSQKGIVVGRGGETIKAIGSSARRELEALFGKKFHLELKVRVKRNWADSERALQQFGYEGQSP
ncbi:MAG: GTPase Era [Chromatiales bacterium]|nr:GTPase Era [Chromatiales bacterium]